MITSTPRGRRTLSTDEDQAPEKGDLEPLAALGPFIRPLPPEEAERLRRLYSGEESGELTRETIVRALLGEFS